MKPFRTIEDRLEQIESDARQIKFMLSELLSKKPAQQEKTEERFMNVKEVADFLKISTAPIYLACAKGRIKFIKLGKSYKFKKSDVVEWMEKDNILPEISVDEYVEKYLQKNILRG
ncbi:MAG TPA: helix-turn-helix domain-containing protein [Puia sp.]|nr:helix-turn-helix domain-containing protein [Puia sp.]